MTTRFSAAATAIVLLASSGPPAAQTASGVEQDSLKVYFASGSAKVDAEQQATLDGAARLFREGNPILMIVAGGA